MTEENIVQLPSLLERLASKLKTCLVQDHANRQEWIAIQKAKCATLVEIRDQFTADIEFGRWCEDNGFGADVINHQTRAAAIAMGRDPEALHACLEATERQSLRTIYLFDFGRFTNIGKPAPSRKKQTKKPTKIETTREAIRPAVEAGEGISRREWGERLGVSGHVVQSAREREIGRLEGKQERLEEQMQLDPADIPATMQKRYEATLRKARRELREEITAEINSVYDVMLVGVREQITRANRIIAGHRGVMSKEVFRKIKACLHPDHNSFVFAAEALQTFSELEQVLVKPDESAMSGPPLPTTAAELMARRREFRR